MDSIPPKVALRVVQRKVFELWGSQYDGCRRQIPSHIMAEKAAGACRMVGLTVEIGGDAPLVISSRSALSPYGRTTTNRATMLHCPELHWGILGFLSKTRLSLLGTYQVRCIRCHELVRANVLYLLSIKL